MREMVGSEGKTEIVKLGKRQSQRNLQERNVEKREKS